MKYYYRVHFLAESRPHIATILTKKSLKIVELVLVIALIFLTSQQVDISKKIATLELELAAERQRELILEQIALSKNLLSESSNNKILLERMLDPEKGLLPMKTSTEAWLIYPELTRAQQARSSPTFGDTPLRQDIDSYVGLIEQLNSDLDQIRISSSTDEHKVKGERIDRALSTIHLLTDDLVLEKFRERLQDYTMTREAYYQSLSKEIENRLSDLLSSEI
ncbi:MAG: hypothetical protein HY369_01695 [Candidatus Aenigmarchaeota archaeon]|nr:hypothetical protein [Candidatus Aenigmarchaeota archaeon]